jgi:hypothetical protein
MQNQSNETPKIIGLSVAIFIVIGIVVWQYLRSTQPAATAATSTQIEAMGGSLNPTTAESNTGNMTLASASGRPETGPGQMRIFSDTLDAEPGDSITSPIQPGRPNAFRQFKPPSTFITPQRPPLGNQISPKFPPPGGPNPRGNPVTIVKQFPTPEPALDMKLDGVILATPSEAVLTVVDSSGKDKAGSARTLYLRVGDKLPAGNHKIIGITEAGLLMEGWKEVWLIGQQRTFGGPKPVETANAANDSKTSLLPSGLFAVPPPLTRTP